MPVGLKIEERRIVAELDFLLSTLLDAPSKENCELNLNRNGMPIP